MPVSLPELPAQVRDGFLGRLDDFIPPGAGLLLHIRSHQDAIIGIPVYLIPPGQLRAGARTESAQPAGWRLLAASSTEGIAADVSPLRPHGHYAIASASVSPNVPRLVELIQLVLARQFPPNQSYELRLLRMKSAYLEIAWLHSRTAEPDLFIPVHSGLLALRQRETYLADRIFDQARAAAERTTGFRLR